MTGSDRPNDRRQDQESGRQNPETWSHQQGWVPPQGGTHHGRGDPRGEQPTHPGPPRQLNGPGGQQSGGYFRTALAAVPSVTSTLLTAVPWFFWSFVVVSWVTGFVGFDWGWVLIVVWILSGVVVFIRPIEDWLARYLFRLRRLTLVEVQRIAPSWQRLAFRGAVRDNRYEVWLQESEEVSATPTPGHVVGMTTWSLYNLPPSHLEAVLAHEASHHLGGRSWLSLLSFWYSIPARCALIAVRALARLMKAIPAVGCAVVGFVVIGYLGILLAVLTFGDSLWFPLLFLTPFVAPPILAWLNRRQVFEADRRTAVMGYGATLVQVLYGWQLQHQQMLGREASRTAAIMSNAPSVAERLRALEKIGHSFQG